MDEHSANVVGILQNKLKSASLGFKEALDIRTESIQASKKRQEQLLQSGQTQALPNLQTQSPFQPPGPVRGQSPGNGPGHQVSLSVPHSSVLSPLRNNTRSPIGLVPVSPTPSTLPTGQSIPQGRSSSPLMQTNSPSLQHHSRRPSTPSSVSSQPYHQSQYSNGAYAETETNYSSSSMHRRKVGGHQYEDDNEAAGPASMLYQQQQYAPQVDQHQQNRSTAIEAIESTMQELGGIFQQLAQMVAEQRDTVQRIEANVDDIEVNINEAQNQLLRYYRNISSDRWLMIKLFLTIIFVFLVVSLVS
ncbi:cis-Golgi t-SNARE syntaxin [Lunasporangiospora selenospora]|uniref:Cis-Golgi t-SNARE syntaxin n=1 Tax=Lunasporangiospora selenospora TaxID=979761 RepID=A0A9P6KGZ5_9FUNG|nr:cis-Golgi t-SNARE syntaxin [Lunasporangiospora selenospora]